MPRIVPAAVSYWNVAVAAVTEKPPSPRLAVSRSSTSCARTGSSIGPSSTNSSSPPNRVAVHSCTHCVAGVYSTHSEVTVRR
ncbi:hypothetical protein [Microbacterium sp. bgisy189]|uniref:hypothetical protein n=1 Tax=Microbacterium sp. bgisy189 TaxID=3413798 RepID=UPI003EBFE687